MNAISKIEYRPMRNSLGVGIALAWMVYSWVALSARHAAAVAGLGRCSGLIDGIKCSLSHGAADSAFAGGMFLALLCTPLAWAVAHYFAHWRVTSAERATAELQERQHAARLAAQQSDNAARVAQVEREAQHAHGKADRSDFLHKLGAVGDFLDLLGQETDPSRIANIRLGAAHALREVTAKHTIDQLAALARSDEAVRVTLTAILRRLDAASFQDAPEAHILNAAILKAKLSPEASVIDGPDQL